MIIRENNILLYTSANLYEKNKKEKEYLDYINNHISNVIKSYNDFMIPLLNMNNISSFVSDEELKEAIELAGENVRLHDISKFSDIEFDPYRRYHYPTRDEIDSDNNDPHARSLIQEEYDEAWKHHRENNPHHPEYWVNSETKLPTDMSLDAIIEMLCDWEAVSLHFHESTLNWYKNDAKDEKSAFSDKTKSIVDDLLFNVLYK